MESVLLRVVLLSLSGFRWEQRAAALPAVTVQVRVGEDATLQCPLLNAISAFTSSAGVPLVISWYRKTAERSPQLLLSFSSVNSSDVRFGSGVGPHRVSVAADGSLLLRGSQRSDAAVYYCSISQGDEQRQKSK